LSAGATIYAKGTLSAKGVTLHAAMSSAWQFLLAAVWLEAASLLLERGQRSNWTREAMAGELFLSIVGSVVAFTLYYWLLRHWEPYKLSSMQLLFPVVAVTEGALLLREPLQWQMAVAMVVILASVAFVLRAKDEEPVTILSEP
jgi:drug/metabolite transporter (DMT)-like permease